MGRLPPLPPAGPRWDLRFCAWAASWHLREGRLGVLPGAGAEGSCPGTAQACSFSQKFQPFKDQGPERELLQAPGAVFPAWQYRWASRRPSSPLIGSAERHYFRFSWPHLLFFQLPLLGPDLHRPQLTSHGKQLFISSPHTVCHWPPALGLPS
ncbi:hypothetical protein D623_10017099 [Myotis brandtii]|uniref:Uncharacterized protein n=1 Tax=Myotis brandtii TaxID=109478 RepID=S7PLL5_MYOBR|nr:hypothetical protein D623_10017099 [Myotis brandtii]